MKITKSELKQIIKEEIEQSFSQSQQLDENPAAIMPMIMAALKNPRVQKVLMDTLFPALQQAIMNKVDQATAAE